MERTLTVVMELNLVQVVLMARYLSPDLHLKLTADMVNILDSHLAQFLKSMQCRLDPNHT